MPWRSILQTPLPPGVRFIEGTISADSGTVSYDATEHRIVWEGHIPGNGGTLKIGYDTEVLDDLDVAADQCSVVWDLNGNGSWQDEAEAGLLKTYGGDAWAKLNPPEEPETDDSPDAAVTESPADGGGGCFIRTVLEPMDTVGILTTLAALFIAGLCADALTGIRQR